jgi:hypothetical protein
MAAKLSRLRRDAVGRQQHLVSNREERFVVS